jgi:hypothetical protein
MNNKRKNQKKRNLFCFVLVLPFLGFVLCFYQGFTRTNAVSWAWWATAVIPASQEAEIRGLRVQSQSG